MAWGRGRSTKSTKMAKHRVKQRENTTIWGRAIHPLPLPPCIRHYLIQIIIHYLIHENVGLLLYSILESVL